MVDPRQHPGGADTANDIQCGCRQRGKILDLYDGVGRISNPVWTGTHGGTDPGRVLRGLWNNGLEGTGVAAGHPECLHRTALEDWPGGKCC